MIVRILGEGQLDLPETTLTELRGFEVAVENAVVASDPDAFAAALTVLLDGVRERGIGVASDTVSPSDLVLPSAGATLAEVSELITEEGLLPR